MDLSAALRHLGLLDDDESPHRRPLAGGFHNDVSLLSCRRGRFVVKHFVAGSTNPLFPQLPHAEHAALRLLRDRGVAPNPIGMIDDVDGRALLVYEYIDGEPWRSGVGRVGAVGGLLAAVHAIGAGEAGAAGVRAVAAAPADVITHAATIAAAGGSIDPLIAAELLHSLPPPEPFAATLVHTDCGPGNIIVGRRADEADRTVLIDWQCPGIGDPVEDLANFASPAIQVLYGCAPLTAAGEGDLLDAYADAEGNTEVVERFHRLRRPYHVRLAAYCAFRRDELRATMPDVSTLYATALAAELQLLGTLP